jgi:hypothetical protein
MKHTHININVSHIYGLLCFQSENIYDLYYINKNIRIDIKIRLCYKPRKWCKVHYQSITQVH